MNKGLQHESQVQARRCQHSLSFPFTMIDAKLLEDLEEELKSQDTQRRKAALLSLVRIGSGVQVHEDVLRLAQEDPDAEIRYIARKALNKFNLQHRPEFEEASTLIQKLLQNQGDKRKEVYRRVFSTEDSFMKVELLRCLLQDEEALSHREELAQILKNLIREEKDRSLVPTYIKALGTFGSSSELPLLQKSLQSKNPRIVANAIEALEELGEESAQNMVLPLLSHEDNRVRANSIRLVHRFDPARGSVEVQKMSLSEHPWMRASALYCLRVLRIDGHDQILCAMIGQESDEDLLTTILETVTPEGYEKLARALAFRCEREGITDLRDTLESTYENLCSKSGLDASNLRQQEKENLHRQQAQESQNEVESDLHHEAAEQKAPVMVESSTKYKSLASLAGAVCVGLLILKLFWETGVVRKSYSLDPLSRGRAVDTHSQQIFLKADFLRARGQWKEAVEEFDSVLKNTPDHIPSLRGKGICLIFLGKLSQARQILEAIHKKKPRDPMVTRGLSQVYLLQSEDPSLITNMLQKAIRLNPEDPILPQTLSRFLEHQTELRD